MSQRYDDQRLLLIKEQAERRRKKRIIIITTAAVFAVAAIIAGGYYYFTYRTFSRAEVRSEIEIGSSSDNTSFHNFQSGFLRCDSNGLVYFNEDGIIWDSDFDMSHPVIDICGSYAAVSDLKQSDIYIYDKNGLLGRITSAHDILDVEISSSGRVAVSTNDGDCNYIELKSASGDELINVKSVFSSSGYLTDIALSDDGNRLAAAFVYVSQGSIASKVVFYDFSKSTTDDMVVGTFSQYSGTILTNVEFMNNNTVAAIGDDSFTLYRFSGTPRIVYEDLELPWEIQSMTMNDNYIMFIVIDSSGEHNYKAIIYNTSGDIAGEVGFDFAYNKATLAGRNVVLYSGNDCQIISFGNVKRLTYTFDQKINFILPTGSATKLLAAFSGNAEILRLR